MKTLTGVTLLTQPSVTSHLYYPSVCCFGAAAAQPAGGEGLLFVVSQQKRWEGFATASTSYQRSVEWNAHYSRWASNALGEISVLFLFQTELDFMLKLFINISKFATQIIHTDVVVTCLSGVSKLQGCKRPIFWNGSITALKLGCEWIWRWLTARRETLLLHPRITGGAEK